MKDLTLPCILVSQGPSKSGASSNRRASSNDLQKVVFSVCLFNSFGLVKTMVIGKFL